MKKVLFFCLACGLLLGSASADSLSFTGTFNTDDQVHLFSFTLATAQVVTIDTLGYAGGTNVNAAAIPQGGFDPVLTLFDAAGNYLDMNDDGGANVGTDSVTGFAADSYLQESLGAGTYILALTQAPNYANLPTLADGFTFSGTGNFTASFFGCPVAFCDASLDQRTGDFALDISGVDSAVDLSASDSAVPEPATLWFLASGLGSISWIRRRRSLS